MPHADVLQIGGYPPPHGGVAIHVQELAARLRARSVSCAVLASAAPGVPSEPGVLRFSGSRPRQFLAMLAATRRLDPRAVHVHIAAGAQALPWISLFALPSRASLVTIHSGLFPATVAGASPARRLLFRRSLDAFSLIIAVSPFIFDSLGSLGISSAKVRVVPAFFPAPAAVSSDPDPALARLRAQCDLLLLTSGFMHPDWGILSVARALRALSHLRAGLVVVQSGGASPEYETQVRAALPDPARALFYQEVPHHRFFQILAASDVYVRASLYDGDSNAVREALSAGKSVVASDCVPRPPGCILFRSASLPALEAALSTVAAGTPPLAAPDVPLASSEQLLDLYQSLLGPSLQGRKARAS